MEEITIVRILEKDFPANIPENIGRKQLEVVNETGKTVGIFYDTSFFKMKTQDPVEYIEGFDKTFVYVSTNYNALGDYKKEEWCKQNRAFDKNAWSDIDDECKARIALGRMAYPYGYFYDFFYNNTDEYEDSEYFFGWCDPDIKIFTNYGRILKENIDPLLSCINDDDLNLWEKVIKNIEAWDEYTVLIFSSPFGGRKLTEKIVDPINRVLQDPRIPYIHRKRLENLIFPGKVNELRSINTIRYTWKSLHRCDYYVDDCFHIDITDGDEYKQPLVAINKTGEIIALLYATDFFWMEESPWEFDLTEYIKQHDRIFECWGFLDVYQCQDRYYFGNWDGEKESLEEWYEKELEELKQKNINILLEELSYLGWAMIALCRLSYPYLLIDAEKVQRFFKDVAGWVKKDLLSEQVLLFNDPRVIEKYIDIEGLETLLKFMFENNYSEMLFENPESFFTKDNIDSFIDYSKTSNNTELLAYLLDYKNKHLQVDENDVKEIKI